MYFKRCIKANCLQIGKLYDFINLFSTEKIRHKNIKIGNIQKLICSESIKFAHIAR